MIFMYKFSDFRMFTWFTQRILLHTGYNATTENNLIPTLESHTLYRFALHDAAYALY